MKPDGLPELNPVELSSVPGLTSEQLVLLARALQPGDTSELVAARMKVINDPSLVAYLSELQAKSEANGG